LSIVYRIEDGDTPDCSGEVEVFMREQGSR